MRPVKTVELSPPVTFFPLFQDSVQVEGNEEVGVMSAIVDENSGDTGSQTAVESSSVHTDEGSVVQSSTGCVTEQGISNVVNPEELYQILMKGFQLLKIVIFMKVMFLKLSLLVKKTAARMQLELNPGELLSLPTRQMLYIIEINVKQFSLR